MDEARRTSFDRQAELWGTPAARYTKVPEVLRPGGVLAGCLGVVI